MLEQEIAIISSLFIFGLFGGLSHCAFMCGPFVLTQVSNRLNNIGIKQATSFKKLSGIALLPYHLGRITTYCLIATLSTYLTINLKNITSFKIISAILLFIGALILASTLVNFKIPVSINLGALLPTFLSKRIKNIINFLFLDPTGFKNYLLGILLGFIPCGLVYGAIITTSSLNNIFVAPIAMLAFGIGTIPALFLTACGSYFLTNHIKNRLKIVIKIILVINIATLVMMSIGMIIG